MGPEMLYGGALTCVCVRGEFVVVVQWYLYLSSGRFQPLPTTVGISLTVQS